VSINELLNSENELYQDILFCGISKFNSVEFSYTELGNSLITNHRPFRKEFVGSHMSKSYRTHSKQTLIESRIDKLINLGLIQLNGKRATKNKSQTWTYEFTLEGKYVAWLIKAQNNVGAIREESIMKLIDILIYYFQKSQSAFSQCISRFLLKCRDSKFFNKDFHEYIEFFSQLLPKIREYETMRKLMLIAITYISGLGTLFVETLKSLDNETQKLALLQIKLDIEGYLHYSTNKEWEIMRFDNIQDYKKITLTNMCSECKNEFPIQLGIFDFIELMDMRYGKGRNANDLHEMKFSCKKCGISNSLNRLSKCYTSWFRSERGILDRGLPVKWDSC
jgi:hypothetical protein